MIKILYVSDTLKQRFGVTSVIMNYIEHFPKEEIKIDLLVFDDSEELIISKLKKMGSNVYFMPRLGLSSYFKYTKFVNSFFEKNHYDIVHSHFNQVDGIIFPIAKRNGVKLCISHSHNTKLSDYFLKSIRNRLMCLNIGSNADIWAACSEAAGIALFGKKYKTSSKKLLINNGVDCEKFTYSPDKRNKIRKELSIPNDCLLIGNIGSFKPQKNQTFLVDIYNQLVKKNKNIRLIFIGDGNTKSEIIEKVNLLGISDKVIFTGVRKDIPDILSALDAFILTSLYEGLPVIGIEAQANGLDCVFSSSITKEVDLTGIHFVNLNDTIDVWCDTISNLSFKHHMDYSEIIKQKGYDIAIESEKLERKYIELLNNKGD